MVPVILDGTMWSYSRLSTYEACPYRFFLTYIQPQRKEPKFFSSFGSHMHRVLAGFYSGDLDIDEATALYLTTFYQNVIGNAPTPDLRVRFFRQGIEHLKRLQMPSEKILSVEKRVKFSLGGFAFLGFIDRLLQDASGDLIIVDHKSHALKQRSARAKPTKSDLELDAYLRQLYLYAVPVESEYGIPPKALAFNCYRTGQCVIEPFCKRAYDGAKRWALDTIDKIFSDQSWRPNLDYYRCRYLCDVCGSCEFYETQYGHGRVHLDS